MLWLSVEYDFRRDLPWHVAFVVWGIIEIPYFLCFAYSGIVAAMGYQMSHDMLQRAQVARQLQASEAELRETQADGTRSKRCRTRHVDVGHRA